MPALDSGRQRARLSPDHLDVVARLVHDGDQSDEHRKPLLELEEAGLVVDGAPVAFLEALAQELSAAHTSFDVEIAGRDGLSGHGALLTATGCWTVQGWPGSDEQEYAWLDPKLLPTWLAATLGLSTEGAVLEEPDLETILGSLDDALAVRGAMEARAGADLSDHAGETIAAVAAVAGITPRLAEVLAFERRAWRVTRSRHTAEGLEVAALAVVDAGPQGLWQRALPAEPLGVDPLPPTTAVRLHRLSPAATFQAVGRLTVLPAA